jgi:hypothetical protein
MNTQYDERAARVWFGLRGEWEDVGVDTSYECLDAVEPRAGHMVSGWIAPMQPEVSRG